MKKNAFTKEFTTLSNNNKTNNNAVLYNYEAAITMLSESFKLFHVSKIIRITEN